MADDLSKAKLIGQLSTGDSVSSAILVSVGAFFAGVLQGERLNGGIPHGCDGLKKVALVVVVALVRLIPVAVAENAANAQDQVDDAHVQRRRAIDSVVQSIGNLLTSSGRCVELSWFPGVKQKWFFFAFENLRPWPRG
jgi:hypothetical protein